MNFLKSIFDRKALYGLAAIVGLTVALYSNSFNNEFTVADDDTNIVQNELIRNLSFEGIKEIFSSYYQNDYRPLTYLSYAIIYSLFGLEPAAFFSANLLLHLVNTILVFVMIQLLVSRFGISIISSLLFAIHPMHIESVTWLSAHNDVLYACFFLLSLIAYLVYLNKPEKKLLYLSVVLFVFSALAKPLAIVLPAVLILIDYFLNRNFNAQLWKEKGIYLAVSLVFIWVTLNERDPNQTNTVLVESYTFFDRVFFSTYGLVFYLAKLIWPFNLSAYYYFPSKITGMLPFSYYASLPIVLLIIAGVYYARQYRKLLIFGLLFFVINLMLVLQIIPFGTTIVADRYSYISYLGLFFIIGYLYCEIAYKKFNYAESVKPIAYGLLAVYTVVFAFTTWNRNKVWKDSVTLTTDVIEKDPYRAMGYHHRGLAQNSTGNYEAAIADFTKAIEYNPDHGDAYANRGTSRFYVGDYEGALEDYNRAIALKPGDGSIYNHRGLTKNVLKDYKGAILDFNKAIKINPQVPAMYLDRGNAKFYLGFREKAIEDYSHAIALKEDFADAYANRGIVRLDLDNRQQACMDFKIAASLGHQQSRQNYAANCQ